MAAKKGNTYAQGCETSGRPTKFEPHMIPVIEAYLEECKNAKDGESLPTVAGLALRLKVSRDTLYAWGEANKEFSDTFHDLQATQEDMLVRYGLAGKYNSTIAKLLLSAKHNYREKSDVTTDGKAISQEITVKIAHALDEI